jgi:hypothetical protein
MAQSQIHARNRVWLRPWFGTLAVIGIYAAVVISTNSHFTLLDDECDSVAIAGRPFGAALWPFFTGEGFHELHPPAAEILLHFWLLATHYSLVLLRVSANILFIAAAFFTAKSAEKVGGRAAHWATLVLSFVWPFAFQYGRIAGWYCLSMLLLSLVTWAYLGIIEDRGYWPWVAFGAASVLLVWSNYFGFTFLFLLLADFAIFHRDVAVKRMRALLVLMAGVAAGFLPLLRIALQDVGGFVAPVASRSDWKNELAIIGYPNFALFGSTAVAPWYLPLSLPIFLAVPVLLAAILLSRGRRWLIYVFIAIAVLDATGNLNIKRLPFVLPWLFLAMGMAVSDRTARYPRMALAAATVIVAAGWIGIISGNHYATSNFYEPWDKIAEVVAQDARQGATIVSPNPPFFMYLDYQLGLESETRSANGSFLGGDLYRSHGYSILQPDDWETWGRRLTGHVVMVNGSGVPYVVDEQNALNAALRQRCPIIGEYHSTPDPALEWKARYAKDVPILAYRVDVTWYNCPG